MSSIEYRETLRQLGFTVASAGRFFGVNPRTGRRWAETGPPPMVAKFLIVMDRKDLSAAQVGALVKRWAFRKRKNNLRAQEPGQRHDIVETTPDDSAPS